MSLPLPAAGGDPAARGAVVTPHPTKAPLIWHPVARHRGRRAARAAPRLGSARPRTEAPFIGCAARAGRESGGPGMQHPWAREPQCHLCPGATRAVGQGPAAQRLRADTAGIHGSSRAGGGVGTRPPPARPTKPAFRAASGQLPPGRPGLPVGLVGWGASGMGLVGHGSAHQAGGDNGIAAHTAPRWHMGDSGHG